MRSDTGVWEGEVLERDAGSIWVDTDPPTGEEFEWSFISVENNNERDACYRIRGVAREAGRTRVDVGDVSFVRGMVDDLDYSKGFLYDFEVGDRFRVVRSLSKSW